jgi:hypothetical protein
MPPLRPDLSCIIASAAVQRRLRPRHDLSEAGWTFWELRTLNLHRVVGLLKEYRQFTDAHDLGAEIRSVIGRNFKRSWWRGMAYAVVAGVAEVSLRPDDLKMLVDVRENQKGTLQWVILVASDAHIALGVHTWMEGYLSPVYRDTLQALAKTGCQITSVQREKDGLMKLLSAGANLDVALHSFGAKRVAFPEFQDPFAKGDRTPQGN